MLHRLQEFGDQIVLIPAHFEMHGLWITIHLQEERVASQTDTLG